MKLEFTVRNKQLSCKYAGPLVGDTVGHYTVSFSFDAEWDGLVKVITFRNGADSAQLIYTGACLLPPQVSGRGELQVACHGYRDDGQQVLVVRTMRMARPLRLLASSPMAEDGGTDFTPSLFAQVVAAAGDARDAAGQAEQIARELQEKQETGAYNGGYYIPSAGMVSNRILQLSYVGSKPEMEPMIFRIPLPSSNVNPMGFTEEMTQPVGVDMLGRLWTAPASGLDDTAKRLLIAILRNGVYTADQSEAIAALETALTAE